MQEEPPVGAEIEALEEDVAEGVVAGQVVHALLPEHQQAVEPALGHGAAGGGAPPGQLLAGEMQGHGRYSFKAMAESSRP